MLVVKSSSSNTELVFSLPERDYFTVELKGDDMRAARKVYAYSPHAPGLSEVFSRMASSDRPFTGTERWESLEGEFSLAAECSRLGAVTFLVSIRSDPNALEEWRVSATVTAELGQLPNMAAKARTFFGVVAGA